MTARDILTIGSKDKPRVLFPKEFKLWKDQFMDYVERQENGEFISNSLINGPIGVQRRRGILTDGEPIPEWVAGLPIHYDID